jgi:hypothetical protein
MDGRYDMYPAPPKGWLKPYINNGINMYKLSINW